MKRFLAVIMVVALSFVCSACGGNKKAVSTVAETETETNEVAETGASESEQVAVGNKIATDFVEITVTEAGITNSLKTSIKSGNMTRIFGPDDSDETDFAFIKGKIMNKSTSTIGNEISAIAKVGEYTLEEKDLSIYKSDGETVWDLSPLVEYNFMLSVEIPNALVESMESCDLNFAFNEGLESSFSEFEEMEYKYTLKIEPEKAAEGAVAATAE